MNNVFFSIPTNSKFITISLLFFIFIYETRADNEQQTPTQNITGRVTDIHTTMPLPGAAVVLSGNEQQKGTITDEDGYFELKDVPVGRITLQFSFLGYHSQTLKNVQLQAGKELLLNIEMEEKVLMGKEVTIIGKRKKGRPDNEMAKVSARSFSTEETERYAGSHNDVARMASNFAGVMGNDDSRNDIIIRGNSPTGLLWRLEGMDIPNPNHFGATGTTGGPVSMLNNTLLTNSDFLTGAFPSEYGNANAGVFDLKMRQGNPRNYEFLGQIGFNGFEGGIEGPFSKTSNASFIINYRYSTLSLFDKMGMDFGTSGVPYYQDLSFKTDIPSTPLGKISVFGLGGLSDIEIWDSRSSEEDDNEMYGASGYDLTNGVDMGLVGVSSSKILNETTYIKTIVGLSGHKNKVVIDSLSDDRLRKYANYRSNFGENTLNVSSFLNKKIDQHHLVKTGIYYKRLGFNYNDSSYTRENDAMEVITNHSGNTSLWQPWFQWQYRITDKLEITAGLHVSHFTLNEETSLEPRAGMKWQFRPDQSFSFGYGLHSQTAPLYIYFYEAGQDTDNSFQPNTDLPMTKSRHLVFSYDRTLGPQTRLKFETYYQHLYDVAVDATSRSSYSLLNEGANFYISFPDFLEASGTGWNYGTEITLERFLHKGFYYLFTGSVFESKYKDARERVHNTAFNNNFVFNLLAGKEFEISRNDAAKRKSLDVNIKTIWAGGKRKTPSTSVWNGDEFVQQYDYSRTFGIKLKDYIRTDLSFSFKIDSNKLTQEWGIEITNLLNRQNIFAEDFNRTTGESEHTYQLGFMFIPHYRIIF
jgi:hypothetical protein